jgi:hypothetical protein
VDNSGWQDLTVHFIRFVLARRHPDSGVEDGTFRLAVLPHGPYDVTADGRFVMVALPDAATSPRQTQRKNAPRVLNALAGRNNAPVNPARRDTGGWPACIR